MKADGGDFVTGGNLGYMNFPPVDGGKGDPSNTVGNPGQYLSISSKATDEAEGDRQEVLLHHDARRRPRSRSGSTPAASRSSRAPTTKLGRVRKDADFLQVRLRHLEQGQGLRPVLGPGAAARPPAETLLDNIAKLFQLSITPAAVRRQHERGHRAMTALAPPAARRRPRRPPRAAGRSGSVAWMALPALVVFVALRRHPAARRPGAQLHHVGRDRRRSSRPASTAGGPCSPTPACRTPCG